MRERVYRAEEPELFGERTHAWENGVNPYYQKPSGKKKPKTQQQATYDTVSAQYDDSGTYTGPANTSYYPESAPAPKPPSAVEALRNVRAKYEKPGEKKEARKRREESFTTKSSAARIVGASAETGTGGAQGPQGGAGPTGPRKAGPTREAIRNIQERGHREASKEFDKLVKSSDFGPHQFYGGEETWKNARVNGVLTRGIKEQTVGEVSRYSWNHSPLKKDSPWKGVKPGKPTAKMARLLSGTPDLYPDRIQAQRQKHDAARVSPSEALRGAADILSLDSAYKAFAGDPGSLGSQIVAKAGLRPPEKADTGDYMELATWLPFAGTGRVVKGVEETAQVASALRGADAAVKAADTAWTGREAAKTISSATAALRAAKVSKAGKRIAAIRAIGKGPKMTKARQGAGLLTLGAAAGTPQGRAAVQGGAEAVWEDRLGTAGSTGKVLANSAVGIPLLLGNAAWAAKQGNTKALEAMAADQITETKKMLDIYLSGDAERIKKATEEDYGLTPYMSGYFLGRPLTKELATAARERVFLPEDPGLPLSKKVQVKFGRKGADILDYESLLTRKARNRRARMMRTGTNREHAGMGSQMNEMSQIRMKARRKFNDFFKSGAGTRLQRRIKQTDHDLGGDGTLDVIDLAGFAQSKAIPREGLTAAKLTRLAQDLDLDAFDRHAARVLAARPELWRGGKMTDKFNALRDALVEAADRSPRAHEPDFKEVTQHEAMITRGKMEDNPDLAPDRPKTRLEQDRIDERQTLHDMETLDRASRRKLGTTKRKLDRAKTKLAELELQERKRGKSAASATARAEKKVAEWEVRDAAAKVARESRKTISELRSDLWKELRSLRKRPAKEAGKRITEIRKDLAYLDGESKKIERTVGAERVARVRRNHAERDVARLGKPDPRLQPQRAKVAELADKHDRDSVALKASIESTDSYRSEINNSLTPDETKAVVDEVNAEHPDLASRQSPKEGIDFLRGKIDDEVGQIAEIQDTLPDLKGAERKAALAQIDALQKHIGVRTRLVQELEMDNGADLYAAHKRAALSQARAEKQAAREMPRREQYEAEFARRAREAEQAGYRDAIYIRHVDPADDAGIPSGNPGMAPGGIGSPKDKFRSGGMARKGRASRTGAAIADTDRRELRRQAHENITQLLNGLHGFERDLGAGPQRSFTIPEIRKMKAQGVIPKNMVILDERLVTDPGNFGKFMDSASDGRSTLDSARKNTVDRLDKEEAAAITEAEANRNIAAQKIKQAGEGRKFRIFEQRGLDAVIKQERLLNSSKWRKVFQTANAIQSRFILGTSASWLFAQPIAELLPMLADNPIGITKALAKFPEIMKDPVARRGLHKLAGNALGTDIKMSQTLSAVSQAEVAAGLKALRATPAGIALREIMSLKTLGQIDRARGAFYREIGFIAEMDRELSATRRSAKAIVGTFDEMEKVANKMKNLPTDAERIKFLDSAEGRAAGMRIARNIDGSLGNWTDLTSFEQFVSSFIIFYPFVRFSVNWVFRTFPKRHPVRAAVLNTMGANNAQIVEDTFGTPTWGSDWAKVPIYGGPNGEITGSFPVNRILPGSNPFVEAGIAGAEKDGNPLFSLSRGMSPAAQTLVRAAMGRDQYGGAIGEDVPTMSGGAAVVLDQMMNLTTPGREFARSKGWNPVKSAQEGESLLHQWPDTGKRVGDDPNPVTNAVRKFVFAEYPEPKSRTVDEFKLAKLWDKRNEAGREANSTDTPYSEDAVAGRSVLERESKWDQNHESFDPSRPKRTETEKRQVKTYLEELGRRNYANKVGENLTRRLFDLYQRNGVKPPDSIRDAVIERRQKAREDASGNAPSFVTGKQRLKYATPAQKRELEAANGRAFLDPTRAEYDSNRESFDPGINLEGARAWRHLKTKANFRASDTPDQMEEKIAKAPTTYSRQQIARLQKLPRKQKVQFAKKILKAKSEYHAALTGRAKVDPSKYTDFDAKVAAQIVTAAMKHGLTKEAAAGLVGNAVQESSLNVDSGVPSGNGGLFGFTAGELAWPVVQEAIRAQGKDPFTDVGAQVDYALTHGYSDEAIQAMNAAKSPEEAAAQFMLIWERPEDQSEAAQAKRGANARAVYDALSITPSKQAKKQAAGLKQKWLGMVARGKAMGVYDVPEHQMKIQTHPGEKGNKGDWDGMKFILERAAKGIDISSTKRTPEENAAVGGATDSDHLTTNTTTYAVDLPATGEQGANIAQTMHDRLGLNEPLQTGTYNWYTSSKFPGTRFQVLWEVEGHFDHVHVGGERTDGGGTLTVGATSPMQQVKAARKAKAAASSSSGGSYSGGSSSSSGVSGQSSNGQSGSSWGNLQDWRGGIFGNLPLGGEGDDLTYPSPVESIVESGSTALTKLPEYKKVKPNKAKR